MYTHIYIHYIYNGIYCLKKGENPAFVITWMTMEDIMLSEAQILYYSN